MMFASPCSVTVVTSIWPKAKNKNRTNLKLFYVMQINLMAVAYFSVTYYHTRFQDPKLKAASVATTSRVGNIIIIIIIDCRK